jgi:hypothetical protein
MRHAVAAHKAIPVAASRSSAWVTTRIAGAERFVDVLLDFVAPQSQLGCRAVDAGH